MRWPGKGCGYGVYEVETEACWDNYEEENLRPYNDSRVHHDAELLACT